MAEKTTALKSTNVSQGTVRFSQIGRSEKEIREFMEEFLEMFSHIDPDHFKVLEKTENSWVWREPGGVKVSEICEHVPRFAVVNYTSEENGEYMYLTEYGDENLIREIYQTLKDITIEKLGKKVISSDNDATRFKDEKGNLNILAVVMEDGGTDYVAECFYEQEKKKGVVKTTP